jgi:hypothetical protein
MGEAEVKWENDALEAEASALQEEADREMRRREREA